MKHVPNAAQREVTMRLVPMSDEDSFDCEICGTEIRKWKSNRYPEFRLIKKPNKTSSDD
jgi:hypothetical protein